MCARIEAFWVNEEGATTVDWVVLTGAATGVALATTATVFVGTEDLSRDVAEAMSDVAVTGGFLEGPMDAESTAEAVGLVNSGLDSDQAAGTWSLGSVDGWINTGSGGQIETWGNSFLGYSTADGSSFIELDATRSGIDFVSTTIDMEAGVTYALSFSHAARTGAGINDQFEVVVNGEVVATISPNTTDSFTTSTILIQGQDGADQIGFREMEEQNNSVGILLDSVQLIQQ